MQENIMVFYGEDSFHIRSKISQLVKKHDIDDYNVTVYDCEETPIRDAVNDAMTIPFMSEKKIVVAKNAHFLGTHPPKKALEQDESYLLEYLKNPSETTVFILTVPAPRLDGRKDLVKRLKETSEIVECKLKSAQDLATWVKRQIANAGLHIEHDAMQELMKRIQSSTELAFQEVRKLLLYAQGESTIDKSIVERVITRNIEDNVYEITNAMLEKNHKRALEVYHDLIMYSEDPLRILGIVVTKFREMLQVKTLLEQGKSQDDIQHYFNVKSGRAYYMVQNAKSVPKDKIEHHLRELEHLDYSIKSGRVDKKMALELFILGT